MQLVAMDALQSPVCAKAQASLPFQSLSASSKVQLLFPVKKWLRQTCTTGELLEFRVQINASQLSCSSLRTSREGTQQRIGSCY